MFTLFTSFKFPKNTKIAIDGIVQSFSHKIGSHRSAWAFLIRAQLKSLGYTNVDVSPQDIHQYDVWIVEHGMEFKGTFNIFGGANDELYHKLNRYLHFKGIIIELVNDDIQANVGELIRNRLKTGTELFKTLNPEDFDDKYPSINHCNGILRSNHLYLGDSHTLSIANPKCMVSRNDGMTLFGFFKKDLISDYLSDDISEVTLSLGNIDIRHHLCRQPNPKKSLLDMVGQIRSMVMNNADIKFNFVETLPIENESRVLPKTGYYKGTPFFGSWQERTGLSDLFNKAIELTASTLPTMTVIKHPQCYRNESNELDFAVMETNRSVHLSRQFYHYDFDTLDLNLNCLLNNEDIHKLKDKPVKVKAEKVVTIAEIIKPKTVELF